MGRFVLGGTEFDLLRSCGGAEVVIDRGPRGPKFEGLLGVGW